MYGNLDKQIGRLIKTTNLKASKGTSKHEFRQKLEAKNSHEINKNTPIFTDKNFKNIESTMKQVIHFMGAKGVKDIEKLSNRMVERYLAAKVEIGVSYKQFQNICAHISKMEGALNRYAENQRSGNQYNFDRVIDRVRDTAKVQLEKDIQARAYDRPADVVNNISDERFNLAASIQHEAGARINEASLIDEKRLGGIVTDPVTGKEVGIIELRGGDAKGGKERDLYLPKSTYNRLVSYIEKNGKLHIQRNERQVYREEIRSASTKSGQNYTGSHGLRHNYARERVQELQEHGKGFHASLAQVSKELGHERPSITEWYLR